VSGYYTSADHLALLAGLMPALFGCALLLLRFVAPPESRAATCITLTDLAFTAVAIARQAGWLNAAGSPELIGFHGALTVDRFAIYFNALFTASSALVTLASSRERRPEYFALLLFAQCGMFFLAAGAELITLYLGLEIMSVCFYALVGFRAKEKRSAEAAIKFVLLGAFSSAVMAYGFSLLYGISGSTLLRDIAGAVAARSPNDPLVLAALAMTLAGILFKISAAPFHMWAPDAYEGAPAAISAYLSVASKAAAVALLLRLLPDTLESARSTWAPLITAAAVLTLTVGNLAAITQNNVKRLLAYSSIAHIGYVLLGLVAGNQTGLDGIAVYLFVYTPMNIGAFAVVIALERGHGLGEDVSDFAGLMRTNPWYAMAMLLFLLSLAGIPPTAGFWGKYYITLALIQTGHYLLAGLAVVYIAVSCYYYFRIVRFLFLQPEIGVERPRSWFGLKVALAVSGLVTVGAGLFPQPLLKMALGVVR
jgi:NADH-quinone oxidoreductase subunit N